MKKIGTMLVLFFISCFMLTSFASAKEIDYLFIQSTPKATLKQNPQQPGTHILTLKEVGPYITYFSERPNRLTGVWDMKTFMRGWQLSKDKNSFNHDAPNGDLSAIQGHMSEKQSVNIPLEMSNPQYDPKAHTLSFQVRQLGGGQPLPNHMDLRYVTLFIDGMCTTCITG